MYVYIHALYGIKIDIYHNSICHGDLIHLILLLMTEWNTVFVYSVPVYDYIIFCKAYLHRNCARLHCLLEGIFAAWLGGWCNGMFPKGE